MNTRSWSEALMLFDRWASQQGLRYHDVAFSRFPENTMWGTCFPLIVDGVLYLVFIAYQTVRLASTVSL